LARIDYFDVGLCAIFLAEALDFIREAALDARFTRLFFATGEDFIVRTVMSEM
jgi:hypothetical protein